MPNLGLDLGRVMFSHTLLITALLNPFRNMTVVLNNSIFCKQKTPLQWKSLCLKFRWNYSISPMKLYPPVHKITLLIRKLNIL